MAVRLKKYFLRIKTFLFFKIESWNFQHLFQIQFRETSQNFNFFSLFGQLLFFYRLSWNFERFHEILFQTDSERKFQLSILKNKKVLFLKKNFFTPLSVSKQSSFVYRPNFQRRFWSKVCNRRHCFIRLCILLTRSNDQFRNHELHNQSDKWIGQNNLEKSDS